MAVDAPITNLNNCKIEKHGIIVRVIQGKQAMAREFT